ncbi:MAG: endonuclease/exonuclease/phosphatase family protein [Parachlamydia sp.]|nr:endonuclease/exonuclease/phosphatase family protein [Parachlamydia sp.]
MFLRKLTIKSIFVFFIFTSFSYAIENSIIPHVEHFEKIENLPAKKYSRVQLEELSQALSRKQERIRVATFNMLFDLYDHKLDPHNRWPQRLPRIVDILAEMQPDILGVQELYPNQLNDLMPHLENAYAFFARPCSDGEMNGIFYRKERFEVVRSDVWYMTDTPRVPGSDTLTMLLLKDRRTGKQFAVFNAHLAFSNIEKRHYQIHFICRQVASNMKEIPVILTGDLNTFPNRLDLGKLPFYDGDYLHRLLLKHALYDSKDMSLIGHLGPYGTFTNGADDSTPFKGTGTPGVFLDHIYISEGILTLIHAVQPGTVGGLYPSDHMPLLIDAVVE